MSVQTSSEPENVPGIDGAVDQVVHRAVVDVVDQIGAEVRVLEHDAAGVADQAVAEHQPVLLVGEFAG
jgi:hypothetical protein